jgi:hypothetical protein
MQSSANKQDNNDDRFRILRNMFVFVGTPLFPVGYSSVYGVYRIFVHFCLCFTFATTIIGIAVNFEDMDYVMESGRPGFAMFNVLWTAFFMRYQPVNSRLELINGEIQSRDCVSIAIATIMRRPCSN